MSSQLSRIVLTTFKSPTDADSSSMLSRVPSQSYFAPISSK